MKPFTKLTAVAAPLDLANVDTDKIIPARYLRKPREAGYDSCLFYDMRFDGLADLKRRRRLVGVLAGRRLELALQTTPLVFLPASAQT